MAGMLRLFVSAVWIGVTSLGGSVGWAQGYPAQNGQIHYDPSKCSDDPHDMVYFAVGRRVLRQPMSNITYITTGSPEWQATLPVPPKPSGRVGCPDHPIQASGYNLRYLSAMPGDKPNAASIYADRVSLVVSDGQIANTQDALFQLMCKTYTLRDYTVPAFVGCKKPFQCNQDISYQAVEYLEPDGTKMALFCSVGMHCSPQPIACDGGYKLYSDFTVYYTFPTAAVPIEDIIATDREIRRRFVAAEVEDFQWRDPKAAH